MSQFIIKPNRDEDFYVVWSSIVEAPVAFGDRDWLESNYLELTGDRFDRADRFGKSSFVNNGAWDDAGFIYKQQGWLRRDRLVQLCDRLTSNDDADVSDLLDPLED